jgi:hypothetical protein
MGDNQWRRILLVIDNGRQLLIIDELIRLVIDDQ